MEEPVAKVSKKMSKLSVSSKPKKVRSRRRKTEQAATFEPEFKYYGCSWPEVVGFKADEAAQIIKKGKPDIYVSVVQEGELMTMCYCSARVRLIVDRCNRVVQTPSNCAYIAEKAHTTDTHQCLISE